MASERAWVAMLSCGHVIGSVPPPMADVDPPMDSVQAQRAAYAGYPVQRTPQPPVLPFVEPPVVGDLVACSDCEFDGKWVVDLIENVDQAAPRLDEKRAGTAW